MALYYFDQDITAYTAKMWAYNGLRFNTEVGYVAVHPARWEWISGITHYTFRRIDYSVRYRGINIPSDLWGIEILSGTRYRRYVKFEGLSGYFLDIYWGEGADMEQSAIISECKKGFRVEY